MLSPSQGHRQAPPIERVGDFLVESVLGEGAAATIYRARWADDQSAGAPGERPDTVALKVLKPEAMGQPHVLASFQFEARVLSRLNHGGILRVYQVGVDNDRVYAAMELMDGVSLDKYLLAKKRLSEPFAVDIARQAAEALAYLHSHGYVHRDIKPANLMLTPQGRVILFDFGTVIRIADGAAYEEGLYGTPAFLAPEQITPGRQVDGRADLYALGMVLYLMVTGRKPFYGSRSQTLDAHLHGAPPPPSDFARVAPELESVILRAIAKAPADRFQTGTAFAQALAEAKLNPAKPSVGDRLRGWLRRG